MGFLSRLSFASAETLPASVRYPLALLPFAGLVLGGALASHRLGMELPDEVFLGATTGFAVGGALLAIGMAYSVNPSSR